MCVLCKHPGVLCNHLGSKSRVFFTCTKMLVLMALTLQYAQAVLLDTSPAFSRVEKMQAEVF